MRLQRYILNEKGIRKIKLKRQKKRIDPIVRIRKAESIVKSGMPKAIKELGNRSKGFNDVIRIMNTIWKKDRISFKYSSSDQVKELEKYKYIGTGDSNYDGDIILYVTPEILGSFNNVENIKKLTKEFVKTLGHELVHRAQWQSYGDIILKSLHGKNKVKDDYYSYKEELKSSHEQMAYAQDAAYEILKGEEPGIYYLYQAWFSDEPQVFQKFVKLMKTAYKKISDGEELIITIT